MKFFNNKTDLLLRKFKIHPKTREIELTFYMCPRVIDTLGESEKVIDKLEIEFTEQGARPMASLRLDDLYFDNISQPLEFDYSDSETKTITVSYQYNKLHLYGAHADNGPLNHPLSI